MENKKTLLIVGDNIANRTMLRIFLDWQYEIIEADVGSTAIENDVYL
jgi:response regulator RpfG family c-di-GMP phosphodiesterase